MLPYVVLLFVERTDHFERFPHIVLPFLLRFLRSAPPPRASLLVSHPPHRQFVRLRAPQHDFSLVTQNNLPIPRRPSHERRRGSHRCARCRLTQTGRFERNHSRQQRKQLIEIRNCCSISKVQTTTGRTYRVRTAIPSLLLPAPSSRAELQSSSRPSRANDDTAIRIPPSQTAARTDSMSSPRVFLLSNRVRSMHRIKRGKTDFCRIESDDQR